MQLSPQQFVRYFLRVFVALVIMLTAFQLWLDPFWAWRKNPPWLAWHGGHNWNLDIRMRTAKPLQLLTRNPTTILIGSSRTYHGFDVSTMPRTYNLGISGLRIRELDAYARYAMMHTEVKHIVIGLDYFMFDARHSTVAGFNPALTHSRYLFDAIPSALYSADALSGTRYAIKGNKAREGVWDYNGHKALLPITQEKIPAMLEAERENLSLAEVSIDPYDSSYNVLSSLLFHAYEAGVKVTLYLSPVHPAQYDILKREGSLDRFEAWKSILHKRAKDQHVTLNDFTEFRFGDETDVLKNGSTAHWQDITHFTPKAGAMLLNELQVR